MVATAGYQAGTETNDVTLSYAQEATYGVLPPVQFQAVRFTGETLAGTKQRSRPGEVLSSGEVAAAVTQQEGAGGNLNFALSYGTFDDLLAGALNNDWSAPVAIQGASGNISAVAAAAGADRGLAATTSALNGIFPGMWILVSGFTQPAMNGLFRVKSVSGNGQAVSWGGTTAITAETPAGSAVKVKAGTLINARVFKSFHIQKRLSSSLFLRYPGSYVTAFSLSGGVGQFLSGSFTFMSQSETQFTVDASTGAVLAAPTGRVHDPVGGFAGVFLDGLPIPAVVDSFTINATANGAKQEYGMGSSAAQGQIMGLVECKGTLKVYFKDFTLYQRFKNETQGVISFGTRDPAGNAYVLSLLAANLINPAIQASGPSAAVMATFDLEGNPQAGGGTIQIDRLPNN